MKPALIVSLTLTALLAACGPTDDPEQPTEPTMPTPSTPEPEQPTGSFHVSSVDLPASCSGDRFPTEGTLALIEPEQRGLRIGGFALVGTAPGEFAGCDADPVDGDYSPRYQAALAVVTSTDDGLTVEVTLDEVFDKQAGDCPGFSVTLEPLGDCDPTGRLVAVTQTVDGVCDLSWAPGEVELIESPNGVVIDWAGDEYDATFDPDTCTLRAAQGGEGDAYLYNGAVREVSIDLELDGVTAQATIEDALDGETTEGERCEPSTITVALERPLGFDEDAEILSATCAVERPPACGDGVCEASETCATCVDDCGCADGEECTDEGAATYFCRAFCDDVASAGQCGDGRRCGVLFEPSMVIHPEDETYCLPSGGREEGEVCDQLADCADGLLCHRPLNAVRHDRGVCSRPCNSSGGCGDGYECELAAGEFASVPDAIAACRRTCMVLADDCPGTDTVCSGRSATGPNTCVAAPDQASDAVGQTCDKVNAPCPDGLYCSFSECVQVCDDDSECGVSGRCENVGVFARCE